MEKDIVHRNVDTGASLSVFRAAELHALIFEAYREADTIEIDMVNVTDCDTAGIQLLYSLKKSSLRDGKKIIIKNISRAVENTLNRMCIPINTII
ncbi:MAG: STAS domain-containing protein [Deltaproteobacteria bacterium]|nr:STAS domain-containing protein [Deltaproteobacteria bacterium]